MSGSIGVRRRTLIIGVIIAATFALFGSSLAAVAQNGHPIPHKADPPLKFGDNPNKLPKKADSAGQFVPLAPARILDTRTEGPALGKQGVRTLQVAGRGGVPFSASAVVMNVTVTNTTAASFLTVWPAGSTRPNASNLNYVANQSVPNLVKVRLSNSGAVDLYNHEGSTDVLADVAGYYTGSSAPPSASKYVPLSPARILDTRTANVPVGKQGVR
ncbi:MAG: hypothetical protein IH940_02290, partial [Acidobacteria bacterium]|nr:hypothetical protein [Acidobacteriota bacterium]